MSSAVTTETLERSKPRDRRALSTVLAFVIGLPLGIGLLGLIHYGPYHDELLVRYTSYPVEWASLVLFTCALGALLTKLIGYWLELTAFRSELLPPWQGQPVAATEAEVLLAQLNQQRGRHSFLGRRIVNVLEFVRSRQSAAALDDQLRSLADSDEMALENSYSLIRFINWAIPILGFLGTVLGITAAISGVTPEVLEHNLSAVTDGLAEAFDTTAFALALTMITMFGSFLMERLEGNLLDRTNTYVDEQLAHRFERLASESSAFIQALQRNTQLLLQTTEQLIQRQVALWSETLNEARQQWLTTGQQQQQALTAGLEEALQRTVTAHSQQLAAQELRSMSAAASVLKQVQELTGAVHAQSSQQHKALAQLMQGVTSQAEMLAQLTANGAQLVNLQETLQQNLSALAGAGAFEQAVASLTAAIHLMTARTGAGSLSNQNRLARPGVAA